MGLYYLTKGRKSTKAKPVAGEGLTFYSHDELTVAHNEGRAALHANIKIKTNVKQDGELVNKIIETTVGRVIFNQFVPEAMGFINELLTKKSLRTIIGDMVKEVGIAKTADFLDNIKN